METDLDSDHLLLNAVAFIHTHKCDFKAQYVIFLIEVRIVS